jgi:hypothetical protein
MLANKDSQQHRKFKVKEFTALSLGFLMLLRFLISSGSRACDAR